MDDAADHAAIIDPRLSACASGQVRCDLRELRDRKPETVRPIRALLRDPESRTWHPQCLNWWVADDEERTRPMSGLRVKQFYAYRGFVEPPPGSKDRT